MEEQQALKQQAKKAGPMYNQLTPEAEEGVMEKIGGGLLSGLEWFGRTLDSITGARAVRGVLGGNFREALSLGPLGFVSDAVGLTDPKDIVGGRELLEKGGILEKNKPGLDWGDAGGFAAEVLLDPSTYFFGAGLATKGVSAATKAGKALSKVGMLDDLLKQGTKDPKLLAKLLAGKSDTVSVDMLKSLEAAGGAMPKKMMGQRQLGRHLNLEDVLRVDDELTDILKSYGKELPEDVAAMKSSFRGISGRSVRDTLTESLEGGADELAELLAETTGKAGGELLPLTSHWSMGFPTLFTGEKGTKGIRQSLFGNLPPVLQRKQYFPGLDTKFGAMLDRTAGRFDTAGKIMRFGKYSPIRPLATIFNPDLKWSARTAEAQEGILASVSKFDRHVAEQQTALNSIGSKWRRHGLFDMQKYTMSLEEGGFGLGEKEAKELIGKHIDELMSWQEGYSLRFADDGMPLSQLPQYDIKSAAKIGGIADINAVKAGNYLNTIENQIGYIIKKVSPEEGAVRLRQLKQAKSQAEEMLKVYTREGETLRAIKNPDDIGHAIDRLKSYEKQFDNVEEYIDVIDKVDFTNTKAFKVTRPKFSSPQGGVHHRLRPEFSQTFREQLKSLGLGELDDAGNLMGIEQDLVRLKSMADEAMDFAKQSGIDIGQLTDEYALYRPRSVTDPRPRGVMGAIEKARAKKHLKNRMKEWSKDAGPEAENLNPLTYRSKQRREYLMDVFGGTTTLNYFYNKYGGIDFTRFRGNRTIGTDIEEKVLEGMASDNYWGHAIQDKSHLDNLLDRGILKEVEVTKTGEILNAHNISKEFDAHGKSVYLDRDNELVGKLATSILLKDSETAKQGAKLFSVDPIRSMLGYYGDVMKASNAAEILVDIASENAYFSIARDVGKFAKAADGEAHTISDIFSKTKLNTVIGKRNFLQRFKAERPDEWRFFKEYWTADVNNLPDNLAAQKRNMINLRKENPEFYEFMLTGPGKLRVGDRVATEASRYAALRGKKVVAITSIDDQGRQIIKNAGPEVPTNTPKTPIDHSPPESTFGSEPMPDGPYQSITSDSVPPTLKQPGVDVVDEAAEVLEETATPKLDLSDENIEAMEDVIAGLREGRYKYEDIPSVDAEFYAAGVMKQFNDLETRRHGRLFDKGGKLKSDWNERYADALEKRIADKMKKLQAKEPVEIPTLGNQPSAQQQVDEIIGSTVPKAPEVSVPDVTPAPTSEAYQEMRRIISNTDPEDVSVSPEMRAAAKKYWELEESYMSYEGDDLLADAQLSAGGSPLELPEVDAKIARLKKELDDDIEKLIKQGDEAVPPPAGDSGIILDTDGRPKIFLHGTIADFDDFDLSKTGTGTLRGGVQPLDTKVGSVAFFTDEMSTAHSIASTTGPDTTVKVMERHIRMENPLEYIGETDNIETGVMAELIKEAKAAGNDGVIYKSRRMGSTYVVFDSNQILKVGEGDSFRARTAAHLDDANKAGKMIESFQEMEISLPKERQRELGQHLEDIIMDKYELDDKMFTTSKRTGGPLEYTLEPWELAMDLEPVAEWHGSKHIEDIFREAKRRMGIDEAVAPAVAKQIDEVAVPPTREWTVEFANEISKIDKSKKWHLIASGGAEGDSFGGSFRTQKEALTEWGENYSIENPTMNKINRRHEDRILSTKQIEDEWPGIFDEASQVADDIKRLYPDRRAGFRLTTEEIEGLDNLYTSREVSQQADEAVTPAAEPTLWDKAAPGSSPTLNAGEKVILEDSLVWNKRNPKSGNYTTKDGGFEVRKRLDAEDKQDGWDLFYLMDDGETFDWQNDYRLLKDAKAGAKEFQESLKAKADAPAPKPQAKPPEQIAPALWGDDQGSLFKTTGEAAAGTGDEGYKQLQAARTPEALALKTAEEHIEQVARTPGFGNLDIKPLPLREKPTPRLGYTPKDAATPKKPVDIVPTEPPATGPTGPTVKPPGTAGTYVFLEGHHEWVPIEELIHMDDIPNHILVNEKHTENLLSNFIIEPELSDDLKRYLNSFTKRDITNEMVAVLDYFTDSFKELATSIWPAFHFRNFISGQVNNMYSGAYDPERHGIMKWVQPVKDAMLLAQGKSIKGLSELPIFKGMSDAQISQAIIDAANGHGLVGSGQHLSDLAHHADEAVSNNFMEQAGGPSPTIGKEDRGYLSGVKSRTKQAGDLGDEVVGEVLGKTIPGYTDTRGMKWFTQGKRMGFQLGNEVEWLNRISPLIAHLKKGLSMEEAIMKVKLAQVDYKALTPFEKEWFKKIIPFYTFTRRQIPFVMEQISDPSSGMSQMAKTMFRTKQAMEDPNDPIPDWISHGVNLPLHKLGLGGSQPGMARYLTGLGGFIGGAEDVMSLISPGHGLMDTVARSSARMGARANPAAQVPIEMMTGVSLFHQRPYKDMKSPTARLLGQVSGSEFVPKWPSPQLDMLLQRIPGFGRTVSTARTITDGTRRPIFDEEGGFSVANLLARTVPTITGAKVHDTDMDRIKNRLLQNRLEEILSRNPNMVKFSQIYIPQDKLMALSQEEREAYMLYKKLGSAAGKASYARRKAAEYSN
jgi:hypothetical protein